MIAVGSSRPPTRCSTASARATAIGLAAALACGCEQPPKVGAVAATAQAEAVLERPRSPAEEDGIELARWSVTADDARIRQALARHAVRGVELHCSLDAVDENGFRVAAVRDEDLASLLAEFGGTTSALTVWHGQMTTWRELAAAAYDPMQAARGSGPMAMIDGRAERLNGWLRLMARGWTVPLEDGAAFELSIVPQLVSDRNDLSGILNRDRLRGRVFTDARISVDLPRNIALVIVGTSPRAIRAEADPEGPASTTATPDGPPAQLPPTIGELLLTDAAAVPPRRVVLALRVRLPATLFPGDSSPTSAAAIGPGATDATRGGSASPF